MTDSRLLHGVGVSPGVGFAAAMVVHWGFPEVRDRTVEERDLEPEVLRLYAAVQEAVVLHPHQEHKRAVTAGQPRPLKSRGCLGWIFVTGDKGHG